MRRAVLAVAYLLAVALFFEGAARLAFASPAFFHRVRGDDDASWRLAWVRQHGRRGAVYERVDEFSPTRGWALRPGLRDLPFFGQLVSSNSRGLRGRREYDRARPAGAVRIVALGDSFTFGEEVGDDDTWCHRLEERLPGAEVLDLGVHGYGQDQMLVYLREAGLRYRPDVVMLGFVAADMKRNLLHFRDYAKPRFVLDGGGLVLRDSPVPSPEEVMRREPWRSRALDVATMLRQRLRERSGAERAEMERVTRAILDAIRSEAESAGAKPIYVYFPVRGELMRRKAARTSRERFFFGYCAERGMACVDLAPFFRARVERGEHLKTVGHWDASEHEAAAEGIAAYLRQAGLAPAPSG